MDREQIRLVQDSFRQLAPFADWAARAFYARLFELDPSLSTLFKGDICVQGRRLMQTLGLMVKSLDRMGQFLPTVRDLGALHIGYGVQEKDYDTVGRALLWTLSEGLGEAFTPEVEAAWAGVYATLAAAMQEGAAEAGALVSARSGERLGA